MIFNASQPEHRDLNKTHLSQMMVIPSQSITGTLFWPVFNRYDLVLMEAHQKSVKKSNNYWELYRAREAELIHQEAQMKNSQLPPLESTFNCWHDLL